MSSNFDYHLKVLRETPESIADVLRERRQAVAKLTKHTSDKSRTEKWKTETYAAGTALIENATKDELAKIRERADTAKKRVLSVASSTRKGQLTPEAALLRNNREQQAWERCQRMLEGGFDAMEVAQQAKATKDVDALKSLKSNLPSYLAGTYGPKGAKVAGASVDAAMSTIESGLYDLASPDEREAIDAEKEISAWWTNLETGFNYAEHEVAGAWQASGVPMWGALDAIPVEDEA